MTNSTFVPVAEIREAILPLNHILRFKVLMHQTFLIKPSFLEYGCESDTPLYN